MCLEAEARSLPDELAGLFESDVGVGCRRGVEKPLRSKT
jgi:hypothetical protein